MIFGLKLPLGYKEAPKYRALFGSSDILAHIRELGFRAVETPVGPEHEDEAVRAHAMECIEHDLKLSLHPYSERTSANPAWFEDREDNECLRMHHRFLLLAGKIAQKQDWPVPVNIHAAAAPAHPERVELLRHSVGFFSWASEWCQKEAPLVQPVAELQIAPNPDERLVRIGDTFEELGFIAERSSVGICWDFGHSYLNKARYQVPSEPSSELLERVTHVHCHDVSLHDHEPLVYGKVPWQQWLHRLQEVGFDNVVTLEVEAERFLSAEGLPAIERSLAALKAAAGDYSAGS